MLKQKHYQQTLFIANATASSGIAVTTLHKNSSVSYGLPAVGLSNQSKDLTAKLVRPGYQSSQIDSILDFKMMASTSTMPLEQSQSFNIAKKFMNEGRTTNGFNTESKKSSFQKDSKQIIMKQSTLPSFTMTQQGRPRQPKIIKIVTSQPSPPPKFYNDFTITNSSKKATDVNPMYFDTELARKLPQTNISHKQLRRTSMLIMGVQGGISSQINARRQKPSFRRAGKIRMDETLFENALAGTLEKEGEDNVFMSEVGWASYLDKQGQSYGMNERASVAQDGYYTPDVFSNPIDVFGSWLASMKRVVSNPLNASFPTISNDPDSLRSWGDGNEILSRTIKPNVKDFEPKLRITGIPGFNLFGSPSSKQDLPEVLDK